MTFHNIELPDDIQYGSSFGLGFNTVFQTGPSGHEQRIQRGSQGRHRYSLIKSIQTNLEAQTLKAFIAGRRGGFASFIVKDWNDFTSSLDGVTDPTAFDQPLGTGDGVEVNYYIYKVYEQSGPNPYERRIHLPTAGSVVVAVDGVVLSSGFTVNTDEGIITFTAPFIPTLGQVITCGFKFKIAGRFEKGFDELAKLFYRDFNLWDLSNFDIIEDVDAVQWPDRFWPGGSTHWGTIADNIRLSFNNGVLQTIKTSAAVSAYLPYPANAPSGAPLFAIWLDPTSSNNLVVRNDDGTAFITITVGSTVQIGLARDASGTAFWVQI